MADPFISPLGLTICSKFRQQLFHPHYSDFVICPPDAMHQVVFIDRLNLNLPVRIPAQVNV